MEIKIKMSNFVPLNSVRVYVICCPELSEMCPRFDDGVVVEKV